VANFWTHPPSLYLRNIWMVPKTQNDDEKLSHYGWFALLIRVARPKWYMCVVCVLCSTTVIHDQYFHLVIQPFEGFQFNTTVFPHIVSAETILFWLWPYVLWPLITVHLCAETIQGRKLLKGGNTVFGTVIYYFRKMILVIIFFK
jgi:hypothetical protein